MRPRLATIVGHAVAYAIVGGLLAIVLLVIALAVLTLARAL